MLVRYRVAKPYSGHSGDEKKFSRGEFDCACFHLTNKHTNCKALRLLAPVVVTVVSTAVVPQRSMAKQLTSDS
jgi:hypothetical protein